MAEKMYSTNPIIKLPENLLLSDAMHKVNCQFTLPDNVKETYYENAKPHLCHKKLLNSENMKNELIVRQENILEKLMQIKEKLTTLQQEQSKSRSTSATTLRNTQISRADFQSFGEQDLLDQQNHILKLLTMLKDELHLISRREVAIQTEKLHDLFGMQNFVLEIICSLKNLLQNEIPMLQDNTQKLSSSVCVIDYHSEVLQLVNKLRGEFEYILQAITKDREKYNISETHIHEACLPKSKNFYEGGVRDIVIYADSASPPYFLLPLEKIFNPHAKILLTSSVHSSSAQVDPNIFRLFKTDKLQERRDFDVVFTVIWKNKKFKTLMVNTFTQSPVNGEANILRYLTRLFPALSLLNYECKDLSDVTEADYWLDLLQTKFLHANNRERQNVLNQLNSKLCTSEWVSGRQYGICDIFLWSVLKQLDKQISFAMPPNVENWLKKISKIEAFHIELC